MDNFLSLPRFAKAGLAVLLAVALLGWGIVAYSSKRQHEDSRSLEQALATLDDRTEAGHAATAELEMIRARLETREADLSTITTDKTSLEDTISQLETTLGEREEAVADLTERLEALQADEEAAATAGSTEGGQALGLLGGQTANIDVETLRERLTTARTALSARSATLAHRDRELAKVIADYEAASARIEELEADLVEQGVLRERLNATMTKLSARSATLTQRDRALGKAQEEEEAASARIEALEADLAEEGVLRDRLSASMTKLSAQTATLAQRDRELQKALAEYEQAAGQIEALEASLAEQNQLREEHDALKAELEALKAEAAKREERDAALTGLNRRVAETEQALENGDNALTVNKQMITESETRLAELMDRLEDVEGDIAAKGEEFSKREQALAALNERITAQQRILADLSSMLKQRQAEIGGAEAAVADLKTAKADLEADIASLTAELDQQEAALADKDDAALERETRLSDLEEQIAATERQMADAQSSLEKKRAELSSRQQEVSAVAASLAELKQERETGATRSIELRNAIGDQEALLQDLEAAKNDLDETRTELGYQNTILSERQEQIRAAEVRLDQLQQRIREAVSQDQQTLASIPIAALSSDNLAVLPIDPLYEPFPIQTPIGVRLTQVHFDRGSDALTPGGLRKAKEAAAWIRKQDVARIRLVGFTDTLGSEADNLSLAERRAASLRRLFEDEGVDPAKIEIIAKGEVGTREITDDETAEPLNRCVGVFIGAGG